MAMGMWFQAGCQMAPDSRVAGAWAVMFFWRNAGRFAGVMVVLPVALQAATAMGANQRAFAIGIMLSASVSVLTPFEPSCILVYGPGKYRFSDFIKAGGGLTAVMLLVVLIMVPMFLPLLAPFNVDLIWFGIMTVLAVEVGLLTPPFGLSVFVIKGTLDDPRITLGEIFRGAAPFALAMVFLLAVIALFPQIATILVK